ncbi:trypsin-like peptidase domain-containing protein [Streptomyces sp. NPDC057543]|uniref:nSTAND1 domain-containing NTPase n=1 Tax=Streptomyces sp. NPDC057543 TaxID=3346163 RepID=UPI00369721E4
MGPKDDPLGRVSAGPSDTSVVRILDRLGTPQGAGFLTGERDVVTCAHVVAAALGLEDAQADPEGPGATDAGCEPGRPPAGRLHLDFPLSAPGRPVGATVVAWVPVQADGTGDIAVLRLAEPAPPEASQARLVEDGAVAELQVRTVGFPLGDDAGVYSAGLLRGRQATGWFQYDTDPASQFTVQRGFSGAPVWDRDLGGVVGMVVTTDVDRGRRTAYMIPTSTLCAAWPPLREAAKARSPFRDLHPFMENDAPVFHGRDDAARRIADRMSVGSGVCLVGASGSGKSSLLNAGVLPLLRRHGDLAIAVLRPGRTPLEELAFALLPLLEPGATQTARMAAEPQVTAMLRQGRIDALVNRALAVQDKRGLLLVVDQFEEALTAPSETDLEAFATALSHCTIPGSRMQVFMALRADFLTAALSHRAVAPLVDDSRLFPLMPMSEEEVRSAVEGPLSDLAVRYEHGLVNRLLTDLGPDPTRLPLLQFTLTRLWEMQSVKNGLISHAHYDDLGGVAKTLANHAEQVWFALPTDDRRHARSLLVQLVHPGGPDTSPTRRTVLRTDLSPQQWYIAERLMTTRLLMPTGEHHFGGESVEGVELAHETLVAQWDRLRDLVAADRDFRGWQEGLRRRIARWESEGRPVRRSLTGVDLREARSWRKKRGDEIAPIERQFIEVSVSRTHRRRLVATAMTVAVALIAATGTFLWRHSAEASSRNAAKATAAAVLVQQSRDAAASGQTADKYNAVLLAMRAYLTGDTTGTKQLLKQNYEVYGFADLLVPAYGSIAETGGGPSVSADGRTIVSLSAAGEQMVWQLGGDPVQAPRNTGRHEDVTAVSPDGTLIAMTSSDISPVVLYDVRTSRVVRTLQDPPQGDVEFGHQEDYTDYISLAYDPTGRRIAAVTGGNRIIVWNAADGHIEHTLNFQDNAPTHCWFTAGGQGLVAISDDLGTSRVRSWNLTQTSPRLHVIGIPRAGMPMMDVSPEGSVLAVVQTTVSEKNRKVTQTISLYRLPSGQPVGPTQPLVTDSVFNGIIIGAKGTRLVGVSSGSTYTKESSPNASGIPVVSGPWTTIDTFGPNGTTALLTDDNLNAVVKAQGNNDPLQRLPAVPEFWVSDGPPVSPAGGPQRWLTALCGILGSTALSPAAEQRLPPGAYRGPLCP